MTEARPVLAVTMGDPAGIGPEIAVRALLSPEVRDISRSFLIGDARVFERALSVCGLSASLNRIAGPEQITDRAGVIDVVHQQTVDPDALQMGKVQALGGEAAYAAIRTSIELAMAGRIAGVATTPINKESLKAAKIPFIGHTEMFADQTGAREEMTMFTISGLKIFFLTRHLSLMEACKQITRDRTLKGIENSVKALRQLGIETPHLAVAALNPHGGEDGLFGREEMDAIKPAIEAARDARHAGERPGAGGFSVPHGAHRAVRCGAVAVSRPGPHRGEDDGFRENRECDAWIADSAHQRRSWDGVRYCGYREGERGQHDRGDQGRGGVCGAWGATGR